MDEALKIIRAIGSPFVQKYDYSVDYGGLNSLYALAVKNKIGLFYLEALKKQGKLTGLEAEYERDFARYIATQETASRISQNLSDIGVPHVIYKFVKAYPTTPSDVDILLLGPRGKYEAVVDSLLGRNYARIAETPSQITVYDLRDGRLLGRDITKKEGGIYYIDLYKEAAASHIIYMDKVRLAKYITKLEIYNRVVMTLHPAADLAVTLIHSVFPEQLYTLNDFYTTLFIAKTLNSDEANSFLRMVRENHITLAVRRSLAITAALHEAAFRSVPEVLNALLSGLGGKVWRKITGEPPYRYSLALVTGVLIEKMQEVKTAKSVLRQLIDMAKPKTARAVLGELIFRRHRQTY